MAHSASCGMDACGTPRRKARHHAFRIAVRPGVARLPSCRAAPGRMGRCDLPGRWRLLSCKTAFHCRGAAVFPDYARFRPRTTAPYCRIGAIPFSLARLQSRKTVTNCRSLAILPGLAWSLPFHRFRRRNKLLPAPGVDEPRCSYVLGVFSNCDGGKTCNALM